MYVCIKNALRVQLRTNASLLRPRSFAFPRLGCEHGKSPPAVLGIRSVVRPYFHLESAQSTTWREGGRESWTGSIKGERRRNVTNFGETHGF